MKLPAFSPPRTERLSTEALFAVLALVMVLGLALTLLARQYAVMRTVLVPTAIVGGAQQTAPSAPAPAADAERLVALASSDLFGHFDPAAPAVAESAASGASTSAAAGDDVPVDLPEAGNGLSLQGVIFRAPPARPSAILAGVEPGTPRVYSIGDALPGDAVIRFIEARRVVIEQRGELKAIVLPEPSIPVSAVGANPTDDMGQEILPIDPPQELPGDVDQTQ